MPEQGEEVRYPCKGSRSESPGGVQWGEWPGTRTDSAVAVPTKKSVLVEAVEFVRPRPVGRRSHVYPLRFPAFLLASLLPNSGKTARYGTAPNSMYS
jgi:hypothetical protein